MPAVTGRGGRGPSPGAREPATTVVLAGDQSAQDVRRTVMRAFQGRPRDIVLDMRAVKVLSDPGVAALLGLRARQDARDRRLTLVFEPSSATAQALSRTGTREQFHTSPASGPSASVPPSAQAR